MASDIDILIPPFGNATTAGVRANFAAAKSEIEELQKIDTIELELANDIVQTFTLCAVNNTPQVIPFSAIASKYPSDSTMYTVNLATGEITFNEPGAYSIAVAVQGIRQTAGVAPAEWIVHSELKLPGGAFVANRARKVIFNTDSTNTTAFYSATWIGLAPVAGCVGRLMQACTDVTKNVGLVSWPAAGLLPRVTAVTARIAKIGPV